MDCAASAGRLDVVQMIHKSGMARATIAAMDFAAGNGHLDVVKFLHAIGEGCSSGAMDEAAMNGHLEVVQFLHTHGTGRCTTDAMDGAAEYGHLSIVEFLHAHRTEGCTSKAMDAAAENGHLNVVQFLHQHRTEGCTQQAMDLAASNGHLAVVEFLWRNRSEGCTERAIDDAARDGHVDVLVFLHNNRSNGWSLGVMDAAASTGQLKVVQFLHRNRTEGCSERAMEFAAQYGWLNVVKYLHQHQLGGCNSAALIGAAMNGHLEVVQFLCEFVGLPCTLNDMIKAACNCHFKVTKYIYQRLIIRPHGVEAGFDKVLLDGSADVLRFLVTECGILPSKDAVCMVLTGKLSKKLEDKFKAIHPFAADLAFELGLHRTVTFEEVLSYHTPSPSHLERLAEHCDDAQRAEMVVALARRGLSYPVFLLLSRWPASTLASISLEDIQFSDNHETILFLELLLAEKPCLFEVPNLSYLLARSLYTFKYDVVDWIRRRFPDIDLAGSACAIDAGDLAVLKKHRVSSHTKALDTAVKCGCLSVIRWLRNCYKGPDKGLEYRITDVAQRVE
ncbi:hypothetical protein HK405_006481, partial [Cladochytrium tenue]